jgi:hypothetical protein
MSAPFTTAFRRAMRPHIAGLRADGLTWQAIGQATGLCAEAASEGVVEGKPEGNGDNVA